MVITKTTERREFINRRGDKIGYCEFTIHKYADKQYATINADMPKYSEYTRWDNVEECRAAFARDIEYYLERILAGAYDEF